jgi:hypothetical protein
MSRTAVALIALAAVAATATEAGARDTAVTVVHRGQIARLSGAPGGEPGCIGSVQYADGLTQYTGTKHAVQGKVSWTIRIPNNAAVGYATWSVRCGPIWHRSGKWRVAKPGSASAGPMLPTVVVTGNGFSQRPDSFGSGSKVSYGIMLENTSRRDADSVYVLVNFVDSTGELLGTASTTVSLVAAGQTYAYGDVMSLRTQYPVAKLEITVRPGSGAPAVDHPLPHFANVRIVPDTKDPDWVSEVDGEIANDTSQRTLTGGQLSLVILDANGAIVGGGKTNLFGTLPAGSRMVFLAQSGFSSIPTQKAASVVISVLPQYSTG